MRVSKWISCQIGARENYAIPRALHQRGSLYELITDLWSASDSRSFALAKLHDRYHPDLADARVKSSNLSFLQLELVARATRLRDWDLIGKRNRAFQSFVINECNKINGTPVDPKVFAYSYAAKGILKLAKQKSWPTVLGQIDGGPVEERIVSELSDQFAFKTAPSAYWDDWREECDLADKVMVNSRWSKKCLVEAGIDENKIEVIPLAFEPPVESLSFVRSFATHFTAERPLRVLFLGQIKEQKGIGALFEAIKLLGGEPIEFWFVGLAHTKIQNELATLPHVKFFGLVPRAEVGNYYREADVFIFPTHSDGFGLTQLEAQAWKLPVIASTYCGDVVRDGENGLLLHEVKGEVVANTLKKLLEMPQLLPQLSSNSRVAPGFSVASLADSMTNLI